MITWATVEGMVAPPGAPTASTTRPSASKTSVGAIEESGRFPGATELTPVPTRPKALGTPGAASKSSIWSLSRIPVPGTTTQLPNQPLTVVVRATAFPSASTTERCEVWWPPAAAGSGGPSCEEGVARSPTPARSAPVPGRVGELGRGGVGGGQEGGVGEAAGPLREEPLLHLDEGVEPGHRPVARPGCVAVERLQEPDDDGAARRRRREGDHPVAAVRAGERRPLHGPVGGRGRRR